MRHDLDGFPLHDAKGMGEREKYGGPQEHSEFQMTLLIFKSSLRIPKLYSNFEDITPNSKTPLRIRKLHSEFEDITPNSKTLLRIRKDQNPLLSAAGAMGCHLAYYLEFL